VIAQRLDALTCRGGEGQSFLRGKINIGGIVSRKAVAHRCRRSVSNNDDGGTYFFNIDAQVGEGRQKCPLVGSKVAQTPVLGLRLVDLKDLCFARILTLHVSAAAPFPFRARLLPNRETAAEVQESG